MYNVTISSQDYDAVDEKYLRLLNNVVPTICPFIGGQMIKAQR